MANRRRITKEYERYQRRSDPNCIESIEVNEDRITDPWKVTVVGFEGTPYAHGRYSLTMTWPSDYPLKPPLIVFDPMTIPYACNVQQNEVNDKLTIYKYGQISHNLLEDKWSPALTGVKVILMTCETIFTQGGFEEDLPLNPEMGKLFATNIHQFLFNASQRNFMIGKGDPSVHKPCSFVIPQTPLLKRGTHELRMSTIDNVIRNEWGCSDLISACILSFIGSFHAHTGLSKFDEHYLQTKWKYICESKGDYRERNESELKEKLAIFEKRTGGFQLFIKNMFGKTLTLNKVHSEDTVHDLKLMIQGIGGLLPINQRLIFAGKSLHDNRKISRYGISNNCSLHLVLRLRGG